MGYLREEPLRPKVDEPVPFAELERQLTTLRSKTLESGGVEREIAALELRLRDLAARPGF